MPANFDIFPPIRKDVVQPKIYGGSGAGVNEFPFVAYLDKDGRHYCTGSLIDREWVLTAAHCLGQAATHIVLGAYDRSLNNNTDEQKIRIAEEIKPSFYSFPYNDVGLIRLGRKANLSDAVSLVTPLRSAALKRKFLTNRYECKTLGWGTTRYDDGWYQASTLQQLDIEIADDKEMLFRGYRVIAGTLVVVGKYRDECEKTNICYGDSGGPTVCKHKGEWLQVGITSSLGNRPDGCVTGIGQVADVQIYLSWVEETMAKY